LAPGHHPRAAFAAAISLLKIQPFNLSKMDKKAFAVCSFFSFTITI
jgi:hypothetical protein